FENGAIHERAGVALIRIANDVLGEIRRLAHDLPLPARRETCTATAAQATGLDLADDLLRCHRGEHLAEGAVTITGDVLLDVFRVDDAAVVADDAHLTVEE